MLWLKWQIPDGVSMKLWRHFWPFKGLKLTLNWKRYRSPGGSKMLKNLFDFGRIRGVISFLFTSIFGTSLWSKISIQRFQEAIASGKKLFIYLLEWHNIACKVVRMFPLNISLQYGGNLSLRYEKVLLFIILWIWRTRLHLWRSDRVIGRAAWYCILSPLKNWGSSTEVVDVLLMVCDKWVIKSFVQLVKCLRGKSYERCLSRSWFKILADQGRIQARDLGIYP